jgi:drug/metabolite transporter (DMT)-like permease
MSPALVLAVALVAVSWSAILVRLCEAPALGIAFWRMLFATLATCLLSLRRLERADLRRALGGGRAAVAGIFLAAHFATWIRSLELTRISSSVLLVNLAPLLSGLAGHLWLADPLGRRAVAGHLLALAGVALVAAGDWSLGGGDHLAGDALAVAGAGAVAGYLLIGRSMRQRAALTSYLLAVYATCTLALAAACLAADVPLGGYPAATYGWIALMAAGPHLLGHNLLNWAVRRLPTHLVQASVLGEPVLASLYALWIFGERPAPGWIAGALCVGAGVAWVAREEWIRRRA